MAAVPGVLLLLADRCDSFTGADELPLAEMVKKKMVLLVKDHP